MAVRAVAAVRTHWFGTSHDWKEPVFALARWSSPSGCGGRRGPCRSRTGCQFTGASAVIWRRSLSISKPAASAAAERRRLFRWIFRRRPAAIRQPYEQQAPVDNSRAPPPKKAEAKPDAVAPTTSIVVMGDAMADWLAYGLEDAFADLPEIAVVRKNKLTRDCCDTRRKAISIGGMLRATCSLRRRRISW